MDDRLVSLIVRIDFGVKLYWWEKIILKYIKLEKVNTEIGSMEFKYFMHRMYIYKASRNDTIVPSDGGAASPWQN